MHIGRGGVGDPTSCAHAGTVRDEVVQGRRQRGSPEGQRIVGKMALGGFLAGVMTPEFEEALVVVRLG